MDVNSIINGASNIRGGDNPPFSVNDVKNIYPQFWEMTEDTNKSDKAQIKPFVPEEVIEMYVQLAHACVKKSRYHQAWKLCMGLFVAHFITMYMQTMVDPDNADARAVAAAGQTKGLMASKSVDGVSASYDFSAALQDLNGWAAWKLTAYGVQYATLAKAYGMGGMRVQ